ncbi:hypothetical protein GCM10027589_05080 [Actinocorallia lasiicapitis]
MKSGTERQGEALRALGDDLESRGFGIRLVEPLGAAPFLRVTSPSSGEFSEHVTVRPDGEVLAFFWSWDAPIVPVSEVAEAAERIAYVLTPQGAA